MNAIRILTYIGISFIYYSCSDYESRMIDGGNAIVERIESYIDSVGTTPESLSDIGIVIVDESNPPYYYEQIDSANYTLYFGTVLGESKFYFSERIINAMQHDNIVGYDLVKGGYFYEEMVFG